MSVTIDRLVELLHRRHHSLVLASGSKIVAFNGRGVSDLFRLLNDEPSLLDGAMVADKVVGKGAAALMILGKVKMVHADVISEPAMQLFNSHNLPVFYSRLVPNIINRNGDGICPVETLCTPCATAEECLPLITNFLNTKRQPPKTLNTKH